MHTILIVEDDGLNMKLFNDLLQSQGFNILQSVDGKDTLQLAREHHPDLIIMDIQLPEVSGLEHTIALKADDDLKDIPVLAVTACAMKGDKERMLEAGCDGYIAKPINIPNFLQEVRRFLKVERYRLENILKTGHPQIDKEHEQIVVLANEFVNCVEKGDDNACAGKINELGKSLKSHLENEYRIMEALGYYHSEEHQQEHQTATMYYDRLIEDAERNGYGGDFTNKLICFFSDFIICGDLGFKMYLVGTNYQA